MLEGSGFDRIYRQPQAKKTESIAVATSCERRIGRAGRTHVILSEAKDLNCLSAELIL